MTFLGVVLDNMLSKDPVVLPTGDLITFHRGTTERADEQKQFEIPPSNTTFDITYFLSKELVEKVASNMFFTHVHNK